MGNVESAKNCKMFFLEKENIYLRRYVFVLGMEPVQWMRPWGSQEIAFSLVLQEKESERPAERRWPERWEEDRKVRAKEHLKEWMAKLSKAATEVKLYED